jgi:hypothetical protein
VSILVNCFYPSFAPRTFSKCYPLCAAQLRGKKLVNGMVLAASQVKGFCLNVYDIFFEAAGLKKKNSWA